MLRKLIRQAESEVAGQLTEHAIAFDEHGNEVFRVAGTVEHVDLPDARIEGMILVHNHPDALHDSGVTIRDIPPSIDDDLRTLLEDRPAEIIVVTNAYRFSLKVKPGHGTLDWRVHMAEIARDWRREIDSLLEKHSNRLKRKIRAGAMTAEQCDLALISGISEDSHRAWVATAKRHGLVYRRERRK